MEKISNIRRNTRVSEFNGLTSQITDEYNKGDYSADPYISALFVQLTDSNNTLGSAIMRDKDASDLAELDDGVDIDFTNVHGLCKGYTYHPDGVIADAAHHVFELIDKYGLEVKTKSYREEYPLLQSLLVERKTNDYQSNITLLPGCDVRFTQLETAVDAFINKQSEHHATKDEEKELDSASVIKKQVLTLLNDEINPYLNAMQKANAALYGHLAQFMANRIKENNAAVRNRNK